VRDHHTGLAKLQVATLQRVHGQVGFFWVDVTQVELDEGYWNFQPIHIFLSLDWLYKTAHRLSSEWGSRW